MHTIVLPAVWLFMHVYFHTAVDAGDIHLMNFGYFDHRHNLNTCNLAPIFRTKWRQGQRSLAYICWLMYLYKQIVSKCLILPVKSVVLNSHSCIVNPHNSEQYMFKTVIVFVIANCFLKVSSKTAFIWNSQKKYTCCIHFNKLPEHLTKSSDTSTYFCKVQNLNACFKLVGIMG